jgi:dTDP-4-dehydrorhamnose reductase
MTVHLVIGASGQVGEHLLHHAELAGHEAIGTYFEHQHAGFRQLDIRDPGSVDKLIQGSRPRVVWLPAARANVDYCESHAAETFTTNVEGVYHVIEATRRSGSKIVYFSSDYVFDGTDGPYAEDDVPRPISEYGRQKLQAEHAVAVHCPDALILRTTVVYGWESVGKNFVMHLVRKLRQGERMKVPVDQIGSPTYAPDLARVAVELADSPARGLYHLVGPDRVDRLKFAQEAARAFQLDPSLIDGVTTAELGQAAPRPLQAGMTTRRDLAGVGTLRGYVEGLRAMVEEEPQA